MTQQVYEDVLSYAIIVLTRYTTRSPCTSFETAPSRRTRSGMGQNLSSKGEGSGGAEGASATDCGECWGTYDIVVTWSLLSL